METTKEMRFFKQVPKKQLSLNKSGINARNITILLKNKNRNSRTYFETLQQEVAVLVEKILNANEMNSQDVLNLIDKSLLLIELDIYLPSPVPIEKDNLLQKTCEIIERFFDKNKDNAAVIAQLLDRLSRNNFEKKYDYSWLYQEKVALFQKIIQKLTNQFQDLLKKGMTSADKAISMGMIATVTSAITAWSFKPSIELMKLLIEGMEKRFQTDKSLTPELACQFLESLVLQFPIADSSYSFSVDLGLRHNKLRSKLFEALAQQALPLLLADVPPLKIDSANELALRRLSRLSELLSHVDYNIQNTKEFYEIVTALNKKQAALERDIEISNAKERRRSHSSYKESGKTYFDLEHDIKYTRILREYHNPKGLQWFIIRRTDQILHFFEGNITYPVKDIHDYLKILRHCIWDINISTISKTIARLCEEVVSDSHIKEVDFVLAINLLWLNMIFSTVLNDAGIAYTAEKQERLFAKIQNSKINEEQARALFEIKTLGWHGGLPFQPELLSQMEDCRETFSQGVNASKKEKFYYAKLKALLPEQQQKFLKANLICKKTGHEIDIAYLGKKKLAINIDGFPHFDPVTKQQTSKTIFRNQCLKKAGWISIDINITDPKAESEKIAEITLIFERLAKTDKKKEQPIVVPTAVQMQKESSISKEVPSIPSKNSNNKKSAKIVRKNNKKLYRADRSNFFHPPVSDETLKVPAKKLINKKEEQEIEVTKKTL